MSLILSYLRNFPLSTGKSRLAGKVKLPEGKLIYTNRLGAKFELHMDQYLMKNIYLYDIPEVNTFNQIEKLLKNAHEPVIMDCGANIGLYSINLAKYFPKGQIHAFEPLNYNFEILQKNIEINEFNHIKANQKGVGAEPAELEIKFGNKKSGASIYVDEYNTTGSEKIDIITIDDYCKSHQIPMINLMKIDVEGGELKVLQGARETLKASLDCIVVVEVIEKHLKAAGDSSKAVFNLMHELGFKAYLPKSWPKNLKQIKGSEDLPDGYADNIFFIKNEHS